MMLKRERGDKIQKNEVKKVDIQSIINSLKKIVKGYKVELDLLKKENKRVKKIVKYTKYNELELTNVTLLNENRRLA